MILVRLVAVTWTQEDADKIRAAILALATGERVVTVEYAGPPARAITYQQLDLDKLRGLLSDAEGALNTSSGRTTFKRIATRKGFRDGSGGGGFRRNE